MNTLYNKRIVLGISGSIAAYKSADLCRRLRKLGAQVRVIMTPSATQFITPMTLQALSGNPVHTDLMDDAQEAAMGHIQLARWADLILVAPATANSIERIASGKGNDLLSAICLASNSKLAIAPAMNHVMWSAEATQLNIQKLMQRGVEVFGPASGSQACGETGEGRLLEVDELVNAASQLFHAGLLQGTRIMITAGPTYESIDPVRYIGNRSSGRMGFAIAEAAVEQGAIVTLVAGPVHLQTPQHVTRIDVESAQQMHHAVMNNIDSQEIFIATAAVADYRVDNIASSKIKKSAEELTLKLVKNPDILADVAALQNNIFTLGFAAETDELKQYALHKLHSKKLDMIAANQVVHDEQTSGQQDTGFNSEYNALQVFSNTASGIKQSQLELTRKTELARQLIELLSKNYRARLNELTTD